MKKRTAQILCAVVSVFSFASVIILSAFAFCGNRQGGMGIIGGAGTPTFWLAFRTVITTMPGMLTVAIGLIFLLALIVISFRRKK